MALPIDRVKVRAVMIALTLGGSVVLPSTILAQDAASLIQSRQATMKAGGEATRAFTNYLRGPTAEGLGQVRRAAMDIDALSRSLATSFPKGTGAEVGVETAALPRIWEDPELFQAVGMRFTEANAALQRAVVGGDADQIRQSFSALGRSCGDCHTPFRKSK